MASDGLSSGLYGGNDTRCTRAGTACSLGIAMKAGLIPNHDVFRVRVARRQMLEKQPAHLQTHFRQTQKLRRILPGHFQGRVEVTPFIFRPIRHGRADAALPADQRKTVLLSPTVSKDTPLQSSGLLGPVSIRFLKTIGL